MAELARNFRRPGKGPSRQRFPDRADLLRGHGRPCPTFDRFAAEEASS